MANSDLTAYVVLSNLSLISRLRKSSKHLIMIPIQPHNATMNTCISSLRVQVFKAPATLFGTNPSRTIWVKHRKARFPLSVPKSNIRCTSEMLSHLMYISISVIDSTWFEPYPPQIISSCNIIPRLKASISPKAFTTHESTISLGLQSLSLHFLEEVKERGFHNHAAGYNIRPALHPTKPCFSHVIFQTRCGHRLNYRISHTCRG